MALARNLTTTPLACGHDFRAEVSPRAGERVWCWACFDYRHVVKRQAAEPAPVPDKPRPKPKPGPRRLGTETHCANGHERTPENTRKDPNGRLLCRICRRAQRRACRARRGL